MVADDDGRWEGNVQKRRYAFLGGCLFVFYFYFFPCRSFSLSFFLSFFITLVSFSKVGYGCVYFIVFCVFCV